MQPRGSTVPVSLPSDPLEQTEAADHRGDVGVELGSGDPEQARAAYAAAVPVIDRMADKGIIHKNKAARHKSRLNAQVKALSA